MKCSTYTDALSPSSMGWASHFSGVSSFSRHKPQPLSRGRRARGGTALPGRQRGGHWKEWDSWKKKSLLGHIQTPLESDRAFPRQAKAKTPLKLMGIFLQGFMGPFGASQAVSLNQNQAWYWYPSLLSVSLPKTLQPPLPHHPLPLQTGPGRIY